MNHIREPLLKPIPIGELHPTQMTVGMREVRRKRKDWERKGHKREFLGKHMIPTVLGELQPAVLS